MADAGVRKVDASIICRKELCSGCGACVNICPHGCINFEEDEYGQKRPVIDQKHCVKCGLCRKTCPNNGENLRKRFPEIVYAGWRKETSARQKSSSGGVAALISEDVVQNGGTVYGVIQQQGKILYQRVDTMESVRYFKGSKYVQANSIAIYKQMERDISEKRKVLVIGTPCLIAGILSYMKQKDSKGLYQKYLLTIDLLCHGTVPQTYLKEYLNAVCRKKKIEFDEITFRSNIPGENYRLVLKEKGRTVYSERAESDLYFYSFLSSVAVKESCCNCAYKGRERCGDITLGDFLGLGKNIPFPVDKTGIHPSLILVNSDAGKQIIKNIESQLELYPRTLEEAVTGGPSLRAENFDENKDWVKRRKRFITAYPAVGFEKAAGKSVGDKVFLSLLKDKVKKLLKR